MFDQEPKANGQEPSSQVGYWLLALGLSAGEGSGMFDQEPKAKSQEPRPSSNSHFGNRG